MYYYYFQAERGRPPAWAKLLTVAQITQMIIGLVINIAWAWGYLSGYGCSCDRPNVIITMGTVMYASYLLLFLKFFVEKYIFPSKPTAAGDKKTAISTAPTAAATASKNNKKPKRKEE